MVRYYQWVPAWGSGGHYVRRFYALVKSLRFDGKPWWDFAVERESYRDQDRAERACEQNKMLWEQYLSLGKRDAKALAKTSIVFQGLPLWVSKLNHLNVHIVTSKNSYESDMDCTIEATDTRASNAKDEANTTTPTTETPSKATSSRLGTSVVSAPAPVKGQENPSGKSTKKSLPSGKRKSTK